MLTQNALESGRMLADFFTSRGQSLQALEQTPLSALITASLALSPSGENAEEFDAALAAGSRFADPSGLVAHDRIMEEAVSAVSRAVGFNLSLARNTVNPIVKQVAEATLENLRARQSTGLSPLAIVPHQWPNLWNSAILTEYVQRYEEQVPEDVLLSLGGLSTPTDLVGAMMSGSERFDLEIRAFADQVGPEAIERVWNALFGGGRSAQLSEVLAYRMDNLNAPLIAFLLANRAGVEIPEGVNASASDWVLYTTKIAARAGNSVVRNLRLRGNDVRSLRLVLQAPIGSEPQGDVLVNADLYNRWLNEGGSPEVIFGALYTGGDLFYNDLLAKADLYRQRWKNVYSLLQSRAAAQRFEDLVVGLNAAMSEAINELDEGLLVVERSTLHARLAEQMTRVKPRHLDEVYLLARKAVCRVMFPHTDAEAVLGAIDEAVKANPELDVREAALLATVDVVAQWLAKLITVVQVEQGKG